MTYLILGLAIWSAVHFVPSIGLSTKTSLIGKFGQNVYKLTFTLITILSLVLIVTGWRSSTPVHLYTLPEYAKLLSLLLLAVAFILFAAAKLPTKIKQFIRHPQLMSVAVWAFAHLLVNGDSRSVVLFAGLGVWAIIEMILINKRDGAWVKPKSASVTQDMTCVGVGVIVFILMIFLHPYLSGISLR